MTATSDHSRGAPDSAHIWHPYESPAMLAATGDTIRPGGFALTERALDLCAFKPGDCVLDVGCGMGATVELLTRRHHLLALGIDRSSTLVSRGLERCPDLPLLVADAARLPLSNGRMDGVFMECVLSITGVAEPVLAEVHRVLKEEGKLILTDMYLREKPNNAANPLENSDDCGDSDSERFSNDSAPGSCLTGALPRNEVERRLARTGFRISTWEDHTHFLKSLAVEIIFKYGSLSDFWAEVCSTDGGRTPAPPSAIHKRLGYYLAVATRW